MMMRLKSCSGNSKKRARWLLWGMALTMHRVIARADVGIAMGGLGSDAAIETADVVLMTDAPSKVAAAIQIGKKTHAIVMQNIVFALTIKVIFIGLGLMGLATM
jgi:Zn2+/Cd2+-exporting ATPase